MNTVHPAGRPPPATLFPLVRHLSVRTTPLLARLLEDSYSAVRFISWRNLRALPGFHQLKYNFVGPAAQRSAVMNSVLDDWQRTHRDVPDALPVTDDGRLDVRRLADLWKRRDQRPVEIPE